MIPPVYGCYADLIYDSTFFLLKMLLRKNYVLIIGNRRWIHLLLGWAGFVPKDYRRYIAVHFPSKFKFEYLIRAPPDAEDRMLSQVFVCLSERFPVKVYVNSLSNRNASFLQAPTVFFIYYFHHTMSHKTQSYMRTKVVGAFVIPAVSSSSCLLCTEP